MSLPPTQPPIGQRHQAAWTLADQFASSLTNFALSFIVLRALSLQTFGAFAIVFSTYKICIAVGRSVVGEPLLIHHTDREVVDGIKDPVRSAAGAAFVLGTVLAALVAAVAGAFLSGEIRGGLLALSLTLPGLMLQDTYRHVFFSAAEPWKAFWNDIIWGVLQLSIVGILLGQIHNPKLAALVLGWGGAGAAAGLLGAVQARRLPRPGKSLEWFREHLVLARHLLTSSALTRGTRQATNYAIVGVAGLTAMGLISAARLLFGPMNILLLGIAPFGIAEGVRTLAIPGRFERLIRNIGFSLLLISLALGTFWMLVPETVGESIVQKDWAQLRTFVAPMTAIVAAQSLLASYQIGLKVLADGHRLVAAAAVQAPLIFAGGLIGAAVGGALTAVTGLALASWIAVFVWKRHLLIATRGVSHPGSNADS